MHRAAYLYRCIQAYLWTLLGSRVERIAHNTLLGQLDTASDELVVDLRMDERARAGDTVLGSVGEDGSMGETDSIVNYSRRENR